MSTHSRFLSFLIPVALVACGGSPAATPDTGTPAVDMGTSRVDMGTPPVDMGVPPVDTGVAPVDMAVLPVDMGVAPVDTGVRPIDMGVAPVDMGTATVDSGCAGVRLTVINALNWCSVSVNGGAPSPGPSQTVCVPSASAVSLVATPLTGFVLGLWHHTTGDTGAGDLGVVSGGMSTASVTTPGAGAACVWVCCPFPGGGGCPTTDQCP